MGHTTVTFPKHGEGDKLSLNGRTYTLDSSKSAVIEDADIGAALAQGGQSQFDEATPATLRVQGSTSFTQVSIAGTVYPVVDGSIEALNPEHYVHATEMGFRAG